MRWSEMQSGQPGLAALGRQRLLEPGVVLVATIRGDGTPRVSPGVHPREVWIAWWHVAESLH